MDHHLFTKHPANIIGGFAGMIPIALAIYFIVVTWQ